MKAQNRQSLPTNQFKYLHDLRTSRFQPVSDDEYGVGTKDSYRQIEKHAHSIISTGQIHTTA